MHPWKVRFKISKILGLVSLDMFDDFSLSLDSKEFSSSTNWSGNFEEQRLAL